jgi:hypothetical protein
MSEGKLEKLLQNYNGQRIEDRPGACAWYPLSKSAAGFQERMPYGLFVPDVP